MTSAGSYISGRHFLIQEKYMELQITTGLGTGSTHIAAFDAALLAAGIHNYNLLSLSSVIPPNSTLKEIDGRIEEHPGDWGDRLYVVMARHTADTPNEEAWAGIGWMQAKGGKGVFVEHHGGSELQVRQDINDSLEALKNHRPETQFISQGMRVQGGVCHGKPLCVISVAAYQISGWDNVPHLYEGSK